MSKLKIAGIVVAAIVVLFIGIGFALPSQVVVTRDIVIDAAPAEVYAHLDAPKKLLGWSPWAKRDPNAKWTFEGPASGVGASYSWEGNEDVGTGTQKITKVVPNERVETSLDFGEDGPATAWFDLEPQGDSTKVTWGLETDMGGPMGRWFGLLMDGFIGPDYEQGLANLKETVEGGER